MQIEEQTLVEGSEEEEKDRVRRRPKEPNDILLCVSHSLSVSPITTEAQEIKQTYLYYVIGAGKMEKMNPNRTEITGGTCSESSQNQKGKRRRIWTVSCCD